VEKLKGLIKRNKTLHNIIKYILDNTVRTYTSFKRNRIFLKNGKDALAQADKAFAALNIEYWLEYGTLLGAVREKGFIAHDVDIDLGLLLYDYSENIGVLFEKFGFKKVRQMSIDEGRYGLEESYCYKGVTVDLFYFTQKDDRMYNHVFEGIPGKGWEETIKELGGLIVKEIYFPNDTVIKIDLFGKKYPVPNNAKEHLKAFYGDSFMIRNKKWNPNTMANNVVILKDKIGDCISY